MGGLGRAVAVGWLGVTASAMGGWVPVAPRAAAYDVPEAPAVVAKTASLEEQAEALVAREAQQTFEEEQRFFREAQALGVTQAVAASGMTPRQQRNLAIAIVREAKRNQLDPLLIVAVIRAESSFNNYAVSGVGAMGLMQVMPDTGDYLLSKRGQKLGRKTNLFDFELNIELGAAYLKDLIRRFGSVEHALVAYNAGPSLARRILAQPDARARFLAGYPRKIVNDHVRLRSRNSAAPRARPVIALEKDSKISQSTVRQNFQNEG